MEAVDATAQVSVALALLIGAPVLALQLPFFAVLGLMGLRLFGL